jgi:hypothetical protein
MYPPPGFTVWFFLLKQLSCFYMYEVQRPFIERFICFLFKSLRTDDVVLHVPVCYMDDSFVVRFGTPSSYAEQIMQRKTEFLLPNGLFFLGHQKQISPACGIVELIFDPNITTEIECIKFLESAGFAILRPGTSTGIRF